MKQYFCILVALFLCVSCSKDNDEPTDSRLETSFKYLKNNIYGTWILDGYHSTSRPSNPYQSLGWDENMIFHEHNDYFKLSFTKDGAFKDSKDQNGTFSIYVDEKKEVYYGNDNDDFYWPFKMGAIYLKIDAKPTFYSTIPHYAEIKSDGKLYLYNSEPTTGGDGVPKYRYKRQ